MLPTLIVANAEAAALAAPIGNPMSSGVEIVGLVATRDGEREHSVQDFPVLGSLNNVVDIVRRLSIREVIVVPSALNGDQLEVVSQWLNSMPDVDMRLSSGLYEVLTTGIRVTRNSVPLMTLNRLRLNKLESTLKAMLDYGLILVTLPFLLPLFILLYVLVKLDSPGPVFYRRRVMGVGGQEFDAFKFRTMHVNGEEILAQHPELITQLKHDHDSRTTAHHTCRQVPAPHQPGRVGAVGERGPGADEPGWPTHDQPEEAVKYRPHEVQPAHRQAGPDWLVAGVGPLKSVL